MIVWYANISFKILFFFGGKNIFNCIMYSIFHQSTVFTGSTPDCVSRLKQSQFADSGEWTRKYGRGDTKVAAFMKKYNSVHNDFTMTSQNGKAA